MKLKKMFLTSAILAVGALSLVACGSEKNSGKDSDGKTEITFWAAPNPTQLKFWEEMATEFEKENPEIKVDVSQMKESPSSEATVQSAIASKTAPTLSENINRSFAAQLAASEALIPLNEKEFFETIVTNRKMTKSIDGWTFSDGNQYVMPVYSNPILFAWRLDLLEELGFNEPPKTYTELLLVADKLEEKYPDKVIWAKKDLADPTAWMRWFDFFPLYNAASEGKGFVEGGKFTADKDATTSVFELMNELQEKKMLLTGESTDPFENEVSLMADLGPWTFPNWAEKFPELKFGENYTVTSPIVPDHMADATDIATYADAKGIVMYAQATEEQQEAGMKFLEFVYSDEKNDMKFLEITSLIPARDDAVENDVFSKYFEENPEMAVYAKNVANAVPAMDNELYNDIQQIFGEQGWVPVVRGEKDAETAWKDSKGAIEGVLP